MRKLTVLLIFLTGCSATIETKLSKTDPNAPVNEINGGVVSYLNQGGNSVIESRRKDAYKKMHDYCGGAYKIVQENVNPSGAGVATPIGNSVFYGTDQYMKIRFECVSQSIRSPGILDSTPDS
jgi:hypothetical protein